MTSQKSTKSVVESVKYALISVYDKTNIERLGRFLIDQGYHLISTGGTYRVLETILYTEEEKKRLVQVSDFTEFPEILDGRVKTLHPKIYGALLARRDDSEHLSELEKYQIPQIDLVVCNLYDFRLAVENSFKMENAVELIDIGGVTLIRASAKNWQHVLPIIDPKDYDYLMSNLPSLMSDLPARQRLAQKAFYHTSNYDLMISNYLLNSKPTRSVTTTEPNTRLYTPQIPLKYGCNPHQHHSYLHTQDGKPSPLRVLNGYPGYINLLDALNGWQLVREARQVLGLPTAVSFKHTSPAGVAVYDPAIGLGELYQPPELNPKNEKNPGHRRELTKMANAFIRARNCDPKSSFGDFIALSDPCDEVTAMIIKREVSDGVIAPKFTAAAYNILRTKKNGSYLIMDIDPKYEPDQTPEMRDIFGLSLSQDRNTEIVDSTVFDQPVPTKEKNLPKSVKRDLLLANITLKYAQSNNVVMAKDGQVIGVAAGQQSRVDAVKLAGRKAVLWQLMQHPKTQGLFNLFKPGVKRQDKVNALIDYVEGNTIQNDLFISPPEPLTSDECDDYLDTAMSGVSMASDAFFPFRDNIDQAANFGVKYVIQPGGSLADQKVIEACDQYGMTMVMTGKRMFTH